MFNVIRLRGKLKGLFFLLRLHHLVPSYLFSFLGEISALSKWLHAHTPGTDHDFYSFQWDYKKREALYENVIQKENLDAPIDYFEFGVSKGVSFRWWTERIKHNDARFYGFDTFTGLPEDWGPFKAGDMSNGNQPPQIDGNRHHFYQGLFQQTLLPFLASYNSDKRKVIHMDADIFTATLYVLTLFSPYLKKGDVIFFDEFNVPMHEWRAFRTWASSFYIKYEVLGGRNNFYALALKVL